MRCTGHVLHTGEMRNAFKILVRKHKWKIPLGRPVITGFMYSVIKIHLKYIVYLDVDWIRLAQERI